ncbi:MAG: hypothetical protein COX19_09965, partial [Desulfobacterales bacterium CG23_combo_of_CG06-09_8_20_14_all_51_8]
NGYLGVPAGDTGPRCEIRDGELLTRDFGRLDADGELRYERGARYQYYPEGGEPVPCDRVAELIMEDPLVLRAAVIGGKR